MAEVDVFAENFTLIDWELHELWIKGLSVTEAVIVMRERGILAEYPGVTQDLLVSDVNDHYRLFAMLEHLLLTVGNFREQLLYQMSPETQNLLIERYYSLDSALCRELLGKKLSSRVRKDLDEVSEKCGVSLKSCRRQFDNIKRVFKTIEEMPGNYISNIEHTFALPRSLAEQYATIVFIGSFRFEMNKRKLNSLSFDAIKSVCLILMDAWLEYDDENEPSLDKDFLSSLKELKVLLDRDKEHRNVVCSRLQASENPMSPKSYSEVESNFKMLTRNLLSLGQSLSSNKEVRDFFVHVVEKLTDPMRSMGLTRDEVALFLKAYAEVVAAGNVLLPAAVSTASSASDGGTTTVAESVRRTLTRFMDTLTPCILAVY